MRYKEFKIILEYDRSKTAQRMGEKLISAANSDTFIWREIQKLSQQQQMDAILEKLESMDPTPNKKYVQWLAKQYINKHFRLEDASRVNQILKYFTETDTIRDFRRRGLNLDINQYDYPTLKKEVVASAEGGVEQEKTPLDTSNTPDYEHIQDMRVLYSGPLGQLIVPRTRDASCELGRGTDWCTAYTDRRNQFKNYNEMGPLYVWIEPDGSKYQFHFEDGQFMDKNDARIGSNKLEYFRKQNPITAKLFKSKKSEAAKDAKLAYKYARNVIQGRWPEAEPVIVKDAQLAYHYAKNMIQGRWPDAEPTIAKDAQWAYYYAENVIRGRWPDAEPTIAKDAQLAYYYARNVIRGRWPDAEPTIAKDAQLAYKYARNVIQGRWPDAEPTIAKDAQLAYYYAKNMIRGRWPDAEPTIAKDAQLAYYYARDVIQGRWPEAEPVIVKDAQLAYHYAKNMIQGRWPDAGIY
jgi:hypothetical protein